MNSELFAGTRVTLDMRCVRRATAGSSLHASVSHHVVYDVRISAACGTNSSSCRPTDVREREYRPSACAMRASISSSVTKSSKETVHGSRESIWGEYSGKSESARSNVSVIPPGRTAGARSGSTGHRFV